VPDGPQPEFMSFEERSAFVAKMLVAKKERASQRTEKPLKGAANAEPQTIFPQISHSEGGACLADQQSSLQSDKHP
jgi:predicted metal-dependent phosphotriesterase family hydrolase